MFWSFEATHLLTRDRISQMQREAARDRLAKLAAAGRSGQAVPPDTRRQAGEGENGDSLGPRDRRTLGLGKVPVPVGASKFGPHDPSRGQQGE